MTYHKPKRDKNGKIVEMGVREGIIYTIGEFECPKCKTHHVIKCNPRGKTKKHWIE